MCGGERVGDVGNYLAPTVFAECKDDMKVNHSGKVSSARSRVGAVMRALQAYRVRHLTYDPPRSSAKKSSDQL